MKKFLTFLGVAAMAATMNAQTNLVQNPTFANDFDNWQSGPSSGYADPTLVTDDGQDDSFSAQYTAITATTGFYQNIPSGITPGKNYTVSFWYKAEGDGTDGRIWSALLDGDGHFFYLTSDATTDPLRGPMNGYLDPAAEWTKYSTQFTAPANAVGFQLAVRAYKNSTIVAFDDFSVEEANLAVSEVKDFDKLVQVNTIVKNEIRFQLPERATVNIYSMDGKLISSDRVSNGQSLNAANLQRGNYIMTIDNGQQKVSRKILKN